MTFLPTSNIHGMRRTFLCSAALAALTPAVAFALPTGSTVAAGSATFDTSTPGTLNINTTSATTIINHTGFDTVAGETVNINQPNATSKTVNRISGDATVYDGALHSNGQVWIINQNGVTFGNHANVDVGSLLVSTAGISDANILHPTVSGNVTHYSFDQASNPTASIIIKGGAHIYAHYADNSVDVLFDESGGQLGPDGTTHAPLTGDLDATNLFNWTVSPGSSVDVIQTHESGTNGYSNTFSHSNTDVTPTQFINMDGSGGTHDIPGVLTTKNAFDAPPGTYTLTYSAAGNNHTANTDGIKIDILDASTGNVLYSSSQSVNGSQPFTDMTLNFQLAQDTNIKIRVSGVAYNLPAGATSDGMGVSLGGFKLEYAAATNSYITLMAPAIHQEGATGGTPGSPTNPNSPGVYTQLNGGGQVTYAAGETFEVDSAFDKSANKVNIVDPARTRVIVDGTPLKGAIQIDPTAAVYVNYYNLPNPGTITLEAKVTDGALARDFDTNHNGSTDVATIADNQSPVAGGQHTGYYQTSDIINVSPDAHLSQYGDLIGYHNVSGTFYTYNPASNLKFSETVVPGDAYTAVTTSSPSPILTTLASDSGILNPQIDPLERPLVSLRDSSLANNFPDSRSGSVNGSLVVSEQNLLGQGTAPAANNISPSQLGNLEPSAGGDATNATADAEDSANNSSECANDHLANPLQECSK